MSPHELAHHWDPNLKDPETFRSWTGPGYVSNLAADIKENGMQNPVQINEHRRIIHDGHHRVLAAMDLGMDKVPIKWVSGRPGEQ